MSPFVALAGVLFRRDGTLNPNAYSILLRAVSEIAKQWGKSQEERHDLLHDLLLKLLIKRPPAETECCEEVLADEHRLFCSCLHVARNHLADAHRKTRRVRTEDPAVLDAQASPEPTASELKDLDLRIIGHKKTEEVMRHLLDGHKVAEIAKAMHMTPRNVLRLQQRGIDRLNKRYNCDFGDHPG
jgi:DNA-directed RNA polymerase specialized sigma24 family protein